MDAKQFSPPEDQQSSDLADYYSGLSPEQRRERIVLEPAFRDAYNEITNAHQVVQVPKYFWDNWAPALGPVATSLYLRLRQYCYYNPETGERRDWCWPKQETLAAQVGIKDPKTLRKALVLLESQGFIKRAAHYRQSRSGGPVERTSDRYLVYFELPLIDSHAVELLARQLTTGAQGGESELRIGKLSRYGDGLVENEAHAGKISLHTAREKIPSKKKYFEEVLNERNVAVASSAQVVAPDMTRLESGSLNPLGKAMRTQSRRTSPPATKRLRDVLPQIITSPDKRDELLRIEALAGDMLDQLGDSRSRPFYRLVARRFLGAGLERLVYQALSELRDSSRSGALRNPAAVFTARVKTLAATHRVDLSNTR